MKFRVSVISIALCRGALPYAFRYTRLKASRNAGALFDRPPMFHSSGLNSPQVRTSLLRSERSNETGPGSPFTPKACLGTRIAGQEDIARRR